MLRDHPSTRPAGRVSRPLPALWLLSDARNDAQLEAAVGRLPRGSAFVYRHYDLAPDERRRRFERLKALCRAADHAVILADSALTAREWGADGIYGAPLMLTPRRQGLLSIATAHDLAEIGQAHLIGADAIMLSPVFPTRSHPGADVLGPVRFRLLASRAAMPVIALGGMTPRSAMRLGCTRWAAIDGLSARRS
ncbi:thiamine phosphate synthase [Qipengyuania sp. JC766]|uniref:thiamine phosphate synthase n=1 Tax=Qipengyuania sp. JC766 TaxID=3232139 RepID=UPI0034582265